MSGWNVVAVVVEGVEWIWLAVITGVVIGQILRTRVEGGKAIQELPVVADKGDRAGGVTEGITEGITEGLPQSTGDNGVSACGSGMILLLMNSTLTAVMHEVHTHRIVGDVAPERWTYGGRLFVLVETDKVQEESGEIVQVYREEIKFHELESIAESKEEAQG